MVPTITNPGATVLTVTGITPLISPANQGAIGFDIPSRPSIGPGGSVSLSFSTSIQTPPPAFNGPASANYQIGAAVYFSDGSVAFAQPVNINVTNQGLSFEVQGTTGVSVGPSQPPELPGSAHSGNPASWGSAARHESNLMSGLAVLGL